MDLSKVFRSHLDADRMDAAMVQQLFQEPPGFDRCRLVSNQVFLGPRGSGKSIALRWLAYAAARDEETRPQFYGIRVPIGRFQFDYFKQTFARTGDLASFLAYFNLFLTHEILSEMQRQAWLLGKFRLPSSVHTTIVSYRQVARELTSAGILSAVEAVAEARDAFAKKLVGADASADGLAEIASVLDTIALLESLHDAVKRDLGYPAIALLLDGIDHLEDLGIALLPLFSKDESFSARLTIKAACRELPAYLYSRADCRVELGRDYDIVPFGLYDDPAKYRDHLHDVMNVRIRTLAKTFQEPTIPDISHLLPTSPPYAGFANLADFSAGNVLVFLETCASALQYERVPPSSDNLAITPASQTKAVKAKASIYLTSDLSDQLKGRANDVRRFLEAVGSLLRDAGKGRTFALDADSFSESAELTSDIRDIVATAAEFRYIVVAPPELIPLLQRLTIPEQLTLSATQAPRHDLGLGEANESVLVDAAAVDDRIRKAEHHVPKQRTLVEAKPSVFVSISGGTRGTRTPPRLKQAYQLLKLNIDVITFREVSKQKIGRYVGNLVAAIEKAQYVVFDITGSPTAGVMVEIGIATGLRKPHAFCWFETQSERFARERVPEIVVASDVKIFADKQQDPFYRWYADNVHGPTHQLSGVCGFRGTDSACDCRGITADNDLVYLRVAPQNASLKRLLEGALRDRGLRCIEGGPYGDAHHICHTFRRVRGAIIDITATVPRERPFDATNTDAITLVEVGYAMGTKLPHACFYFADEHAIESPMLPEARASLAQTPLDIDRFADWYIRQIHRSTAK